jgi:hypothetical protein
MDTVYDIIERYVNPSDTISGIFSMFVRNLPLADPSFKEIEEVERRKSVLKEFQATQTLNRGSKINYKAVLGNADERTQAWSPLIPIRTNMQEEIFQLLVKWRDSFKGSIILPRSSRKSMGWESSSNLCWAEQSEVRKRSTTDLERFHMMTGEWVEGTVEMRQSWFFNDLKPRTYFANGATTYRHSRFTQPVFNRLLDTLPNTHRKRRFNMRRLSVSKDSLVFVYDYTSFTSLMDEQRHFLQALAEFCRHTALFILDSHYGPLEVDLGDLIDEYNQYCNSEPEFTIREDLLELSGLEDKVYKHLCAGFLGVHSNLASCTALHGIHLALMTNDFSKASVVGDDALGIFDVVKSDGDIEEGEIEVMASAPGIMGALKLLGEVHRDKTKIMSFEDTRVESCRWQYLKRCLDLLEDQLKLGNVVIVPTFGLVYSQEAATTRRMNEEMSLSDIRHKFSSQAFATVTALYKMRDHLYDEELASIFAYLRVCYSHLDLPYGGYLFCSGVSRMTTQGITVLPSLPHVGQERDYTKLEPIQHLLRQVKEGIEVPVSTYNELPYDLCSIVEGSTFEAKANGLLSFSEKMGWVKKRVQMVAVEDPYVFLARFFDRASSLVYEYEVCSDLPSWWTDVSSTLYRY